MTIFFSKFIFVLYIVWYNARDFVAEIFSSIGNFFVIVLKRIHEILWDVPQFLRLSLYNRKLRYRSISKSCNYTCTMTYTLIDSSANFTQQYFCLASFNYNGLTK